MRMSGDQLGPKQPRDHYRLVAGRHKGRECILVAVGLHFSKVRILNTDGSFGPLIQVRDDSLGERTLAYWAGRDAAGNLAGERPRGRWWS